MVLLVTAADHDGLCAPCAKLSPAEREAQRINNRRFKIETLHFPIDRNTLPEGVSGGWIPVIADLQKHEVVDRLRNRWSSFRVPYLQKLSAAILSRELVCLSIDSQHNQWLSFEDPSSPLHVAPPSVLSGQLRSKFPFHQIPGLADFVEHFGGLANWTLPPCPWFVPADECRVVASDCDYYDWGMIGNWAGSLTLYNTSTGNFIVVSPKDRCAKWDHDIGWERDDEDPFADLNWTMSDLIDEFIAYQSLDENEAKASPFFY
jgi:hypothetical protein